MVITEFFINIAAKHWIEVHSAEQNHLCQFFECSALTLVLNFHLPCWNQKIKIVIKLSLILQNSCEINISTRITLCTVFTKYFWDYNCRFFTLCTMLQKLSKCEVLRSTIQEFICHSILSEINFGKIWISKITLFTISDILVNFDLTNSSTYVHKYVQSFSIRIIRY